MTPFDPTRVVVNMENYAESDFSDDVLVCIPKIAWEVARSLLRGYGLREINYAASYTVAGYELPDINLWDKIDAAISSSLGENDMTNLIVQALGDVVSVLNSISISNAACCSGGSYGAGNTDPPPNQFEDDGTNYPTDWDNRTEYLSHKCATANAIIAGIKDSLEYLAVADIAALTVTALAATLLVPIPFSQLAILLGLLVALLAQAALAATLAELIAHINANAGEIVCVLYEANSAAQANAALKNHFTLNVSASAATLVNLLINFAATNVLFQEDAILDSSTLTMGESCDDCCPSWGTAWTIIERTDTYVVLESLPGATESFCYASAYTSDANAATGGGGPWGPYCGTPVAYDVTVVSGVVTDYATFDDTGTPVVAEWTSWPGSVLGTSVRHFFTRDLNQGVYRIRLEHA